MAPGKRIKEAKEDCRKEAEESKEEPDQLFLHELDNMLANLSPLVIAKANKIQ